MSTVRALVAAAWLALALGSPLAGGEAPAEGEASSAEAARALFDEVYGEEVARVRATREAADDAALAERLLEAADAVGGQPAMVALLCEKACELGMVHPAGHGAALRAGEALAERFPERADAVRERLLEVYRERFKSAAPAGKMDAGSVLVDELLAVAETKADALDADGAIALLREALGLAKRYQGESEPHVSARLRSLYGMKQQLGRAAALEGTLQHDPADASARRALVMLYLVDLDHPGEAARHVGGLEDAALGRYVPGAAKGPEAAPELACLEMGDWYRGLAAEADAGSKGAMLERARGYYARFLDLHAGKDIQRTKAEIALAKVEAELEALGSQGGGRARWIDVLRLVDPARHTVNGEWRREGATIVTDGPWGLRLAVPVLPRGDYELEVGFTHTGPGYAAVVLPVGRSAVTLYLSGPEGRWLDNVAGEPWPPKGEARQYAHKAGERQTLAVRVTVTGASARVSATLNGEALIEWKGEAESLRVDRSWRVPQIRCLGLGSGNHGRVVFDRVRLRARPGRARLLRAEEVALLGGGARG